MSSAFEHRIQVMQSDIDEMGHVNNVVYLRWVQDVASKHWDAVSTDRLKQTFKWVVLRHEIDYKSPAFLNDEVIGITWVGSASGARFERFVRLNSARDGRLLAEAKTIWCMLDASTGRPTRITPEVLAVL
jgi:acyl-CoA thioester hydrolase